MNEPPRPADLEDLVLGSPRRYTRHQAAALVGVSLEDARRYWRALGFADTGDAVIFTDADVAAMRRLLALVDDDVLSEDNAVNLVRALGHTTARLAEWEVDLVVEQMSGGTGRRDDLELADGYRLAEALLPALEMLLVHAWRRRLAAAVHRMMSVDDTLVDAIHATVGFADLVGFTRLARRLDERELAGLVERFEHVAADIVSASGGRLVKTLGDEVLFVADRPREAADAALSLLESFAGDSAVPELRVGLATGLVVSRMGDVFGTTVNLASRLTALARPGSVLCDQATAAELDASSGFATVALWRRPLRGLGLVEPFALRRAAGAVSRPG